MSNNSKLRLRSSFATSRGIRHVRRLIALLAIVVVLGATQMIAMPQAAYASCSETTKFVEELTNNPATGNLLYFGNEGTTWTYSHIPICSSGEVAQSFFMQLSVDYTNWVETGAYQLPTDSSSHTHDWGEWGYYPSPPVVNLYDSQAGVLTTGTYYSFKVSNGNSTSWNLYILHSSTPSGTWKFIANTGNLAAFAGIPESELSRYGDANASDEVDYLNEQDAYGGSWTPWQHLGCDNYQDSIKDWAVVKTDNSDWYMVNQAPASGQC